MADIISNIEIDGLHLTQDETLWVYNGLDCCITSNVYEKLKPEITGPAEAAYNYERAMLGPAITMVCRGFLVDPAARVAVEKELEKEYAELQDYLDELTLCFWDKPLNHASAPQMKKFFYETLQIPKITKVEKGKTKITTDKDALEKIINDYVRAMPVAKTILAMREIKKKMDVVHAQLDEDGRMRTSYNVAGTETWRWSSSGSPFYSGTNLQNVTKELRSMFIPDPGYTIFYADLQNAEGRTTGYLSSDEEYIKAAESEDMHTIVTQMVWSRLPWTGDPKKDRKIAERGYLGKTYRDLAKRGGHGTNYGLSPISMARNLHIKQREAFRFQFLYLGLDIPYASIERWEKQVGTGEYAELLEIGEVIGDPPELGEPDERIVSYHGRFPGIRQFHERTIAELQTTGAVINPFGFKRSFWGRLTDDATIREALAHVPQSTIGILLNVGLWRIWRELECAGTGLQILGQVHDAVVGQVPNNLVDKLMPRVIECLTNPLTIRGKTMIIPVDVEVGNDWKNLERWQPKSNQTI